MRQFVPTHIHAAREVVATERERTSAERDAFGAFHDRIEALDASPTCSADGPVQQLRPSLALQPPLHTRLQRVWEAYRETVMSVPHYAEDYGESLAENLAAEFEPAVARAVVTRETLPPPLRERLLAASQRAHDDRAVVVAVLDEEGDALRRMQEQLRAVADLEVLTTRSLQSWSSEDLAEAHKRVCRAEQRCNELASERQAIVHTDRVPGSRRTEVPLHDYLYQSLSVSYPVLADSAELADALGTAHDRIDRAGDARACDGRRIDTRLL